MLRIGSELVGLLVCLPVNRPSTVRMKAINRQTKGFTLIEVMVTTAVLSLGIVMLFHSFFICADTVHHASNVLAARLWMDGKIAQEKEGLLSTQSVAQPVESGTVTFDARDYDWQKSIQPVDDGLYSLTLTLSWREAARTRTLSTTTYLAVL